MPSWRRRRSSASSARRWRRRQATSAIRPCATAGRSAATWRMPIPRRICRRCSRRLARGSWSPAAGGQQTIPVEQFFTGLMSTALGEGDLLTAIEVPAQRRRAGQRVREVRTPGVALRRHRRRGGAGRQRRERASRRRWRIGGLVPRPARAAGGRAPPDRTGTFGRHHGGCRRRRRQPISAATSSATCTRRPSTGKRWRRSG